MRTEAELKKRLENFDAADYIYWPGEGYLAWHFSTGDNLETLFIEVDKKRAGVGTRLYREMCFRLMSQGRVPYHSVFCFRLSDNEEAGAFYRNMGWTEVHLGQAIYRDRGTTLLWITWLDLLSAVALE